ncbi:conserved hypothetical protein [Flavobacterium sp. 9AF]|uniref:hypothetical protein n=1 Tax=Flavobacterium sp. 9AF TaxID=2653142 RepID=UPI0012F303FD|nr:hypothetical protein [Flavobacterium sp. 9AF]VXB51637.1 conserved hypothetical protein [Flavobacterium sp. 9AF]
MKKLNLITATLLFVTATLFQSCNKDEDTITVDQELLTANAQIDLSNELDFDLGLDVANNQDTYSNRNGNTTMSFPSCATISVQSGTLGQFPITFAIDFGTNCLHNGILRSGIITITFDDYLINYGSHMTIERSNYYVNGRKIEGTVVYENQTSNTQIPKWSRTVTNGKLTTISGNIFTFYGTRIVQQIAGVNTIDLNDNEYEVLSGTHTVNRPNGSSLTVTVVSPLIKKYSCTYISQGQLNLQGALLDGILDYGNNTCDNQATYTHSNGVVYNITL